MSSNFLRYLSNAPVLAILFISAVLSIFIVINWVNPDILSFTQ